MAFPRVKFSKIFPGEHAPGPPYIIRRIGTDSLFVSPVTWCLTFSYKNNLHTYGKQMMIPSLDEVEYRGNARKKALVPFFVLPNPKSLATQASSADILASLDHQRTMNYRKCISNFLLS